MTELDKSMDLPIIRIRDKDFIVDVYNKLIVLNEERGHEICFSEMYYGGDHYSFMMNPSTYDLPKSWDNPIDMVEVKIPQMCDLHPEGMRRKFAIDDHLPLPLHDSDFKCNEDLLNQRINGELPRIKIAGKEYIIDLALRELRSYILPDEPYLPSFIDLRKVDSTAKSHQFFYDIQKHQQVDLNPNAVVLPRNVKIVEIPLEERLDPVATALHYNLNIKDVIKHFPIESNLVGRIIPIKKSLYAETFRENQRTAAAQKKTAMKVAKPGAKRGR